MAADTPSSSAAGRPRMRPEDYAYEYPEDCLLRDCTFTWEGNCTVHSGGCPDCPCGTPLHWEPR